MKRGASNHWPAVSRVYFSCPAVLSPGAAEAVVHAQLEPQVVQAVPQPARQKLSRLIARRKTQDVHTVKTRQGKARQDMTHFHPFIVTAL